MLRSPLRSQRKSYQLLHDERERESSVPTFTEIRVIIATSFVRPFVMTAIGAVTSECPTLATTGFTGIPRGVFIIRTVRHGSGSVIIVVGSRDTFNSKPHSIITVWALKWKRSIDQSLTKGLFPLIVIQTWWLEQENWLH